MFGWRRCSYKHISTLVLFLYKICFTFRVLVVDKVTDFLLLIGKLLIVGGVGKH